MNGIEKAYNEQIIEAKKHCPLLIKNFCPSEYLDVFYYQFIKNFFCQVKHNNRKDRFALTLGNAIYVPSNLINEIIFISPRVAPSFMFNE